MSFEKSAPFRNRMASISFSVGSRILLLILKMQQNSKHSHKKTPLSLWKVRKYKYYNFKSNNYPHPPCASALFVTCEGPNHSPRCTKAGGERGVG